MYDCYVQFFLRRHSYTWFDCLWKTGKRIGATVNLYAQLFAETLTRRQLSENDLPSLSVPPPAAAVCAAKCFLKPMPSVFFFEIRTHYTRIYIVVVHRTHHTCAWEFYSNWSQARDNVYIRMTALKFGANRDYPHFHFTPRDEHNRHVVGSLKRIVICMLSLTHDIPHPPFSTHLPMDLSEFPPRMSIKKPWSEIVTRIELYSLLSFLCVVASVTFRSVVRGCESVD